MAKMDALNSTLNTRVRFERKDRGNYNPQFQPRRTGLNLNHIKFDLLKISELYDGVLTEDLGHLPLDFYNKYLMDLVHGNYIYGYTINMPESRIHEASGDRSFTYTINIQSAEDRASKALKIHVGFYKSAWCSETMHSAEGMCCMPNRLDRQEQ
jgi:hypothetical protein